MSAPVVASISAGFKPTSGYPRPILLQDDQRALLYFTGRRVPKGDEERAVAIFDGCLSSRFGYPNDEALNGHSLYAHGLGFYGIFEVSPSPWLEEIRNQNKVSFPSYEMPHRRHIIVTLHDNVFECLTKDFKVCPAGDCPVEFPISRLPHVK